jgi:outer membrane protein assembly factor BamB
VSVVNRPRRSAQAARGRRSRSQPPRRGGRLGGWLVLALTAVGVPVAGVVVLASGGGSKRFPDAVGLDVLPFPGTPDASPNSQITFPALKRSEVKAVSVTGSRSGVHAGRLEALPGGRGTAFAPTHPFAAGERVSVGATLSRPAAGIASGGAAATRLSFAFTVATPARDPAAPAQPKAGTAGSASKTAAVPRAAQSFHSEPGLHPPAVSSSLDPEPSSDDIFLTPNQGSQSGPMIIDSDGQLVWFDPIGAGQAAFDLAVQTYDGQLVLTFWQGKVVGGHGIDGKIMILNNKYQTVATVHAGDGYSADLHEVQITPEDTALMTAYVPVKGDLSSVGGPGDGNVLDSVVQEVDIKTGQVLWEWHALGHVPLSESNQGKPTAGFSYDYFHVNSIEQLPNGNVLVSARNTSAIYEISRQTGEVIWQLGGKGSSFTMGPGTTFYYQHDARLQPDGTLTAFDDGATPKQEDQSRALQLKLDTLTMTASLVHSYTHSPALLAGSQGSMQILRNGNVFVGWGAEPDFSEYTPDGKQIFTGSFTAPVQSYRAVLSSWKAQPITPPAIAVNPGRSGLLTVYASWNGATEVASWQLLAGATRTRLTLVKEVPRSGFDTAITTTNKQRYLAVRALDSSGRALGTSAAVSR